MRLQNNYQLLITNPPYPCIKDFSETDIWARRVMKSLFRHSFYVAMQNINTCMGQFKNNLVNSLTTFLGIIPMQTCIVLNHIKTTYIIKIISLFSKV